MIEFFADVLSFRFLQYALLAGLLASISGGIVGSYVTVRRITYMAGAIAHCTLGGMGAARYFQSMYGLEWCTPLLGATISALLAAFIIATVTRSGQQRMDTVLGAVWALGMATGLFFISKTPGYSENLMSYLFGDILMVTGSDLWLMGLLDIAVLAGVFLFYNKILLVCFDSEFASLRGIKSNRYQMVMLCVTALTVVLLVQVVGIVLVIALLTLPAATAAHHSRRLWQMMVISVALSIFCTIGGIALSYKPDLPAGATIIALAGVVYILSLLSQSLLRSVSKNKNPRAGK